jgi:hypothetical protein
MQKIPESTLLFQPLPLSVKLDYRGHCFVLEPRGGLTFGAMAEVLRALRDRCQKEIDKLVKLPCTLLNRREYAQAMELLDNPNWRYDIVTRAESWIFLKPEGAICDDSDYFAMARKGMTFTGW